jgi:hypothetical protein
MILAEIRKRPHHRPKMMASMKWTKQFCWLCLMNPFLLYFLYGR